LSKVALQNAVPRHYDAARIQDLFRKLEQIVNAHEDRISPTLATEVASTSGTSVDFTGIPTWVRKITIQFFGVSVSGTSPILVQLGDSGGIETTGYLGSGGGVAAVSNSANHTAGFGIADAGAATAVFHGVVSLTLEDSVAFTWLAASVMGRSDGAVVNVGGGSKSLSAALDRVRITTTGGTDTFDLGSINILYE
jgi:hypothetical protein